MKAIVTDSAGHRHELEPELVGIDADGMAAYELVLPFPVDREHPPVIAIDFLPGRSYVNVTSVYADQLGIISKRLRLEMTAWIIIAAAGVASVVCYVLGNDLLYVANTMILVAVVWLLIQLRRRPPGKLNR